MTESAKYIELMGTLAAAEKADTEGRPSGETNCSALRDCPFCGHEEPHTGIDGTVTCGNCGANGPWDRDAYDGAGTEQEMWNCRRDITTSDVQDFLVAAALRMQDEIRSIPRTGTGTLTARHKLRGAMDFGIELSNWISRSEIAISKRERKMCWHRCQRENAMNTHSTPTLAAVAPATTCSTVVFRVQDRDGRGPWKPGFSERWVEDRDDHDNLPPWYMEMGPVHKLGIAGMHQGTACETLEQLRRWFTKSEYRTLRRYGYQAVQMEVGRILGKSETQLVFERSKPCNVGCVPVALYPSNAEAIHGEKDA